MGYLMPKQLWYYLTDSWGEDKGVYIFPKGISPKENIIAWLGFELAYYNVIVQHISHCATETTPYHLIDRSLN